MQDRSGDIGIDGRQDVERRSGVDIEMVEYRERSFDLQERIRSERRPPAHEVHNPRVPKEHSTSLSGDLPQVFAPIAAQLRGPVLALRQVEHEIEKPFLVSYVPVERHGAHVELLGDAAHVDGAPTL